MTKLKYLLIFSTIAFVSACSTTKRLPPGQKLYDGPVAKIVDNDNTTKSERKALTAEMEGLARPKPNGSILGLRFKLYVYEHTMTNKRRGLKHYLHTHIGEPPVLVSAVDLVKNSSLMQNRLQNEGYFQAQVSGDTVSKKHSRVAKAVYTIQTGPVYRYRKITFPVDTDALDSAITQAAPQSILKVGDKYNLDIIKNERIRIDAKLKEKGFFYFAPEDLLMKVDSGVGNHQVDVFVKVKYSTPDEARWVYQVRNIYVYPNYSIQDTSHKLDSAVHYGWYNVIDTKHTIKPYVFKNSVLLHPGDIYNRTEHTNTLNRMVELGPFSYVKNEFEDVTPDSAKLDIYYFLTQYKKKSIEFDVTARQTSADYSGTQFNLSWKNRNIFKGAELLTINLFTSTDVQFGHVNNGYNIYQYGISPTLSWPRFISPFNFSTDNAFIPHTILTTQYTLIQESKLFTLNSYSGSWGYQWKPSLHKQNTLDLLDVTYVDAASVTQVYLDSIRKTRNPQLEHVINNQFTFGPSYSFNYTNTTEDFKKNTFYYLGKVSLSGNIYGLITGADTLNGKVSKLFGTPFDQYVKLENEFRFYHKLGPNDKLAARIMVDVGIPYGNSTILPYSQQFFIGGPNSLRGFQARSIGPGTYYPGNEITGGTQYIPDQSGDIKIEGNIEWRPKLFSIVEGALFADAGNIWDLQSHPGLPGGAFGKNFLSQIAGDVGAGLRFNLSVLVLRTDLGFPVLEPYQVPGSKLDFSRIRINDSVFSLAIGYPF
jgi:outer membrane protein insertion porin family